MDDTRSSIGDALGFSVFDMKQTNEVKVTPLVKKTARNISESKEKTKVISLA